MASQITVASPTQPKQRKKMMPVIDCDVHEGPKSVMDLVPYMAEPYRSFITKHGWKPEKLHSFRQAKKGNLNRMDAIPEDGSPAGSDYNLMKKQLLDEYNIKYAMLTGLTFFAHEHSWPEFTAARAAAYNDWLIENWLEKDKRFLGSIQIPRDPHLAAKEIDRVGSHPQMVQVCLHVGNFPWGHPYYFPMIEAAARHDLVLFFHVGTSIEGAGTGEMRYYVAWRSVHPQAFMTQVVSLIANGALERWPNLRVVVAEGGFEWVPFLLRHMDHEWKQFNLDTPWVKRPPSEYVLEHMRFTTQPWHDLDANQFMRIVDLIGSDEFLMFASDYPHWDFDPPDRTLPPSIPESLKRKILYENAQKFYNLPSVDE